MSKSHDRFHKTQPPKDKALHRRRVVRRAQAAGQSAGEPLQAGQRLGNRALQRLIAQRKGGDGAFELDDDTAARIHRERGGGQPLDSSMAQRMAETTGHDFSGVRVHTSPEAADLNQRVNAVAFTTGQDIFFSDGAYQPGSSSGQELLAHELTHVAQQGGGSGGSGPMTVNAPGDAFEQEADATAQTALSPGGADVQRQEDEEETEG
jgi:hypothetical protein